MTAVAPAVSAPELLRPKQAAAYIGLSRSKIFQLIRDGELDSRLLSTRVRVIPRAACDDYVRRIAEQAAQHTPTP